MPENLLKFTVGVMLSGFGVFWIGKGAGFDWPGADLAVLYLVAGFLLTAVLAVFLARWQDPLHSSQPNL